MCHADLQPGRSRVAAPYVAPGVMPQSQSGGGEGGQTGQTVGVHGRRSCRLSPFPLCSSWANAAKWL
jgi:hypothetical protein